MSVGLVVLIAVAVLVVLLLAETPVAFALAISGLAGIVLLQGTGVALSVLAATPFTATAKYGLVIVPMFVLMGLLILHAGISTDIFTLASKVVGARVPGGLAVATVLACALFAAVTGSSVATVATIGRISIKEMVRHGYSPAFAAGVVGAAGTLGILIPPSIVLVIYGILTGESIGLLLLAGIFPGVVSAILYAVFIVVRAKVRDEGTVPAGGVERGLSVRQGVSTVASVALIFTIVVGGIYSGVFTATEAGAAGAFAALLLMCVKRARRPRELWVGMRGALQETASLTSMIFLLLLGGGIFSYFLVSSRTPATFTAFVLDLSAPGWLVVVLILAAMIPLGMILDGLSILLITVPLAYPIVTGLGYDGIWFGILVIKMIEIGLITPPLGVNVYVVAGVSDDVTVEQAFRGIGPFMLVDLVTVAVFFAFPGIVMWLPELAR